jgi:hypothetical protein
VVAGVYGRDILKMGLKENFLFGLDTVVHTYVISTTQEAEIRGITVCGQPRKKVTETSFPTNKPAMVICACHPNYWDAQIEESWSKASPRQKMQDLI